MIHFWLRVVHTKAILIQKLFLVFTKSYHRFQKPIKVLVSLSWVPITISDTRTQVQLKKIVPGPSHKSLIQDSVAGCGSYHVIFRYSLLLSSGMVPPAPIYAPWSHFLVFRNPAFHTRLLLQLPCVISPLFNRTVEADEAICILSWIPW